MMIRDLLLFESIEILKFGIREEFFSKKQNKRLPGLKFPKA